MSSAIGGYFELELYRGRDFHDSAIKLNTGRNALEYILRANGFSKIYLPLYSCDVLLQPIKTLGIHVEYYSIDNNFEAVFDFQRLKSSDVFLYINYFGIKDSYLPSLQSKCKNLIIDNAQAFFSKPLKCVNTFYSPRKFLGVPDGAYLYTDRKIEIKLKKDISYKRFEHLLRRIDIGAEDGFLYFQENEKMLNNMPILEMSDLTKKILLSINYSNIASKRRENFDFIHQSLKNLNQLSFALNKDDVPMVYPLLTKNINLRDKLIQKRIYTATYWSNVFSSDPQSIEYQYSKSIIHLPTDQRYGLAQLSKVIEIIKE